MLMWSKTFLNVPENYHIPLYKINNLLTTHVDNVIRIKHTQINQWQL
jgi:hypothetical protein